jgi:hypothetical protein
VLVAAIFFPQAKQLGIEVEAACSPQLQRKVVTAATEGRSYENASTLLAELGEAQVSAKQCERITQRIGRERIAERTARLDEYERLPLPAQQKAPASAPSNAWKGRVAAVLVDGGRAQIRDGRWGQPHPPGAKVSWWKEPKVACLATFSSEAQESDPLPEVPECLLDPLWVIPLVKDIKRGRSGEAPQSSQSASAAAREPSPQKPPRWSPEPLVRSVVATFAPYEELARLAAVEAYHRGFSAAPRKVFLGDGHLSNWAIHQQHFSHYTPVVDLLHALSHVYHAALESTADMEACWQRCACWIAWVWQGQVQRVIDELRPLVESASDRSRETLEESLTYLTNNASRMRYDQYRQAGLPITTTIIESTIKQINRRMKGTEKFWRPGAEPQLQLCADRISETDPLATFWQQRPAHQTGFRKSRTNP